MEHAKPTAPPRGCDAAKCSAKSTNAFAAAAPPGLRKRGRVHSKFDLTAIHGFPRFPETPCSVAEAVHGCPWRPEQGLVATISIKTRQASSTSFRTSASWLGSLQTVKAHSREISISSINSSGLELGLSSRNFIATSIVRCASAGNPSEGTPASEAEVLERRALERSRSEKPEEAAAMSSEKAPSFRGARNWRSYVHAL